MYSDWPISTRIYILCNIPILLMNQYSNRPIQSTFCTINPFYWCIQIRHFQSESTFCAKYPFCWLSKLSKSPQKISQPKILYKTVIFLLLRIIILCNNSFSFMNQGYRIVQRANVTCQIPQFPIPTQTERQLWQIHVATWTKDRCCAKERSKLCGLRK